MARLRTPWREQTPESDDYRRWTYGLWAVGGGLVAIFALTVATLWKFDTAEQASQVLGIVIGPVATIVGAYFGVAAGSDGKAKADANAQRANETAIKAAAMVTDPEHQQRLIESFG